MDIKDKLEEIVKKVSSDKNFAAKFKKDPVKVVEGLLGTQLPEEQINSVIAAVKAKVSFDSIGSVLDSDGDGKPDLGAVSKLGGLFK